MLSQWSQGGRHESCSDYSGVKIQWRDNYACENDGRPCRGKHEYEVQSDSVQTGTDNGISKEPVIYTKTGEAVGPESGANISVSG